NSTCVPSTISFGKTAMCRSCCSAGNTSVSSMSVNDDLENFHQGNVADDPEYAAAYELFHPRKIKIRSVKLAQGGRLLRISHTNSSSSLERKLDLKRSVRDQKEKLIQAFELKLTTG